MVIEIEPDGSREQGRVGVTEQNAPDPPVVQSTDAEPDPESVDEVLEMAADQMRAIAAAGTSDAGKLIEGTVQAVIEDEANSTQTKRRVRELADELIAKIA